MTRPRSLDERAELESEQRSCAKHCVKGERDAEAVKTTSRHRRETQERKGLQHRRQGDARPQALPSGWLRIDASASRSGTPQDMSRDRPGTRRTTS